MKTFSTIFTLVMFITIASTLTAQVDWEKDPNNPVLSPIPGSWESDALWSAFVLKDADTLKMWYTGVSGIYGRIGYATSTDGISWEKHPNNPVLDVGAPGSWDAVEVADPFVIILDDTTYKMWYGGRDNPSTNYSAGYATSRDGINWTKADSVNPVLPLGEPGTWDRYGWGHSYYFDGSKYHVWYAGSSTNDSKRCIGYATSPDGINWTKNSMNPVFCGSDSWANSVWGPHVIFDGSKFKMWYAGYSSQNTKIGYATSSDGLSWVAAESAVLDRGVPGKWDELYVSMPSVIIIDTTYHMWFDGVSSESVSQIGYATAPDILDVPDDFETIQSAINIAQDGDIVLVAEGTYYENINFKGKAITVASQFYMDGDTSHISKTIIDGSQTSNPDSGSVVYFVSGEDTTSILCGFTITGGIGTSVPQYESKAGGGIACYSSGGRITSNKIVNNTLNDNYLFVFGGGFGAGPPGSNAYVILEKNIIKHNEVTCTGNFAFGGGVALACNGRLIDNEISYNTCTSTYSEANGGGVKITTESELLPRTVIIKGNKITHNFAKGKKVTGHRGAKGGGIVNHYCKVIILDNDICYNQLSVFGDSDAHGAGISMSRPNNESLISGNTISYNNISENIPGGGGGMYVIGSVIPIVNNIISGNSASNGGGILLRESAASVINNTIVNNNTSSNGGGLYSIDSSPVVINTIFWANEASSGSQISGNATVRYSDIQGGRAGKGNINADPQFIDTLLYNLSELSPCVGTGIDSIQIAGTWYYCPATDFSGRKRPYPVDSFVDMGARESQFPSGINERYTLSPFKFRLMQNYPNPFNPRTVISWQLAVGSNVELSIYNILGQKIETLLNKPMPAGYHEVEFNGQNLSSGIYLYRIVVDSYGEAAEWQDVKKMVYLK